MLHVSAENKTAKNRPENPIRSRLGLKAEEPCWVTRLLTKRQTRFQLGRRCKFLFIGFWCHIPCSLAWPGLAWPAHDSHMIKPDCFQLAAFSQIYLGCFCSCLPIYSTAVWTLHRWRSVFCQWFASNALDLRNKAILLWMVAKNVLKNSQNINTIDTIYITAIAIATATAIANQI